MNERIENIDRYLKEIENSAGHRDRIRELSREAIRKFELADHYEVLIDSTIEKN